MSDIGRAIHSEWCYGDPSDGAGWYAVLVCWDEHEGMFPSAAEWTGRTWGDGRPIVASYGRFRTQKEAEKWAFDHDLGV